LAPCFGRECSGAATAPLPFLQSSHGDTSRVERAAKGGGHFARSEKCQQATSDQLRMDASIHRCLASARDLLIPTVRPLLSLTLVERADPRLKIEAGYATDYDHHRR
jgi:hypothetical protein